MSTPAVEVRSFAVTIPAATTQAAPHTSDLTFPPRLVVAVHWKVPPGPSGLMGWRLTMSGGNAVIPTGGGWIITDNDSDTWYLADQPDSGQWELTGYNTDTYDHTVYLDFLLDTIPQAAGTPGLIPNASITSPAPATVPAVPAPAGMTVPAVTTPAPVSIPPPPPVTIPAPAGT